MNKNAIITIVVLVIIVIAGYLAFANKAIAPVPADTAATTTDTSAQPAAQGDATTSGDVSVSVPPLMSKVITYTDAGFSPKTLSVKVGDTVKFVNNSSHGMWVASDNHPTHTEYDGTNTQQHCANGIDTKGSFDECTAVNPGTVYSFTFSKAGTFEFHNHVRASDTGSITVTQ